MKRGCIQDGILQCYFSSKIPTFLTMFFILLKPLRCDLSMHSAMQVNVVTKVFKIILSGQIISWILHSIYNFLHIINKNNVFNSYSCILIWPIRGPNGHNNNRIYTHLFHQPLDHIPFYTCVKEWESYKSN